MVLVAIDTNGQLATVFGSLVNPHAGATSSGKHHVSTLGKLGLGQLTATGWIAPSGAGSAGHVGENLCLGVGVFSALLVTALELANQRNIHAPDKTDFAGFAGHCSHGAYQKAAFMLLEHDRLDVRLLDHHVNDGELQFGELFGDFFDAGSLAKTDTNDGAGAPLGHAANGLLALRFVGHLKIQIRLAGFLFPLFHAAVGRFVKRFVKLAAHVIHDGRLGKRLEAGCQRNTQ